MLDLSRLIGAGVAGALASAALAQPDGMNIPGPGMTLLAVQDTPTGFGDAVGGGQDSAGGSELDGLWAALDGSTLRVAMTGNLEGNFNKLWIFLDGVAGGENTLQGDNVDGGFNEILNFTGLTFDAGFEPDHGLRFEVGGGFLGIRAFDLIDNTAGDVWIAGGPGDLPLVGAAGGFGVTTGWDNSNVLGVDGASAATALTATQGWELSIDLLSYFGEMPGQVGISAFITNGGGDFASNQFLPGVGGAGNFGSLMGFDLNQVPGDQFAVIPAPGAIALLGIGGLVGGRRRR